MRTERRSVRQFHVGIAGLTERCPRGRQSAEDRGQNKENVRHPFSVFTGEMDTPVFKAGIEHRMRFENEICKQAFA